MKRRNFLKMIGVIGVANVAPNAISKVKEDSVPPMEVEKHSYNLDLMTDIDNAMDWSDTYKVYISKNSYTKGDLIETITEMSLQQESNHFSEIFEKNSIDLTTSLDLTMNTKADDWILNDLHIGDEAYITVEYLNANSSFKAVLTYKSLSVSVPKLATLDLSFREVVQ